MLEDKIKKLREILNGQVKCNSLQNNSILETSHKLDDLIIEYYKAIKNEKKGGENFKSGVCYQ